MRGQDLHDGEFSALKWNRFGFFEIVFKPTSLKFVELNFDVIFCEPEVDRKLTGSKYKMNL